MPFRHPPSKPHTRSRREHVVINWEHAGGYPIYLEEISWGLCLTVKTLASLMAFER